MAKGIFIAGTDTGAGKTYVTCRLLEQYRALGIKAAGMKPVASGMSMIDGQWVNEDVEQIWRASGRAFPRELINQYVYQPFIAPHLAAEQTGAQITIAPVEQCYRQLEAVADVVIVEGAGGLMTPINDQQTYVELVRDLALEAILVVGIRLGCINHALLTQQVLQQSKIPFAGWVANYAEAAEAMPEVVHSLEARLNAPLLGVLPWSGRGDTPVDLNLDLLNQLIGIE